MIREDADDLVNRCLDCQLGLDHCHDVFILHGNDDSECSKGADCTGGSEVHGIAIHCRELVPPCGC